MPLSNTGKLAGQSQYMFGFLFLFQIQDRPHRALAYIMPSIGAAVLVNIPRFVIDVSVVVVYVLSPFLFSLIESFRK